MVQARVDNLGSQDAVGVSGTLEMMTFRGWEMVANSTVPLVLGGSHSTISFPIVPNSTGPLEVRISVLMERVLIMIGLTMLEKRRYWSIVRR